MNDFGETFDDNNNAIDESMGFDPIPDGDYLLGVEKAEVKDTASGGQRLSIMWTVVGPSHAGRKIFSSINFRNPNKDAERIGRNELAQLRVAGGIGSLTDSSQLVGVQVIGKVRTRPAKDGYDAQNVIRSYSAAGAKPTAAKPQAAAQSASAGAKPPWAK